MLVSYGLRIGYNKWQPHKLKRFKMINTTVGNVRHLMSPQNQKNPKTSEQKFDKIHKCGKTLNFYGIRVYCGVIYSNRSFKDNSV